MSYDSDGLAGFDAFFGRILASMSPAKRRAASRKLGQALRRSNLARIAANTQPDGTAMEPRKPQKDTRGRLRRKKGAKMFRKLRQAKQWRVDARADSVEIKPRGNATKSATEHHFGLEGRVGKAFDGRTIRARYAARRLLGFGADDEQLAMDIATDLMRPG